MSSGSRGGALIRAAILASIGGTLLALGWRRWTHVIIDYGRELYVPWRLSLGEVLFRDLAYFNGPLSPYFNSLIFRVFEPSYTALFLGNLALLVVTTLLLYRLLHRLADHLVATMGCALFLVIFALADLNGFGNYNFLTPYSHEMTHASLLGILLLLVLINYLRSPSRWRLVELALLLGLIFLTKAEFFLAGSAAVVVALILRGWMATSERRSPLQLLIPLIGGLLVPPLVAFGVLLTAMPLAEAFRGTLGPWPYMFQGELTDLVFYRKGLGTDDPAGNLTRMLTWLGLHLAIFVPLGSVARLTSPESPRRRWIALGMVLWTVGLLVLVAPRFNFTDLPRPLPLLLLAAIGVSLVPILRRQTPPEDTWRRIGFLSCLVYALALLAKMPLHTRFQNYGFALALPATVMMVLLLLQRIPAWLDRRGGYGASFRLSAAVFLLMVGLVFFWPSVLVYQQKTVDFGHGPDGYRVQPRYRLMSELLDRLPAQVGPDETMLVLPEGIMLNFQLRRLNPTPHINFMPPELIMFGEEAIIAALEASPPDVIVLIKRRTIEYGFETLGNGYGEELIRWVSAGYPVVEKIEDPELYGKNFGMALILRRAAGQRNAPPEGGAQVR